VTSQTFRRSAAALSRRVPDGVLVLPSGRGDPMLLGGTAAVLWDALSSGQDVDELVLRLGALYEDSDGSLRQDVDAAIDRLAAAGAIEPVA
jgi:coenzyme PQQ synthesis protein D (PqqD)